MHTYRMVFALSIILGVTSLGGMLVGGCCGPLVEFVTKLRKKVQ
jgi:methionine synthase I (cobalamin-dependent)